MYEANGPFCCNVVWNKHKDLKQILHVLITWCSLQHCDVATILKCYKRRSFHVSLVKKIEILLMFCNVIGENITGCQFNLFVCFVTEVKMMKEEEEEEIIRCLCGLLNDEGLMIQCEKCMVSKVCLLVLLNYEILMIQCRPSRRTTGEGRDRPQGRSPRLRPFTQVFLDGQDTT